MSRLPLPALAVASALVLSGCGDTADPPSAGSGERLDVVVGVYPYQYVVERVGGDDVQVRNLTPPGAEPHDVELSPREVGALGEADLVVYSPGFQPALDDALEQQDPERALDVLSLVEARPGEGQHAEEGAHVDEQEHAEEEHAEEGVDPHVWLDPTRLATIASAVAERLGELDPGRAEAFRDRAEELTTELTALDADLETGLASCARSEVVVSHAAFGYLTERYGLTQVAITGLSPEVEPSPRRLAEVAELARDRGVTTIFFEELVSPRVAEQLAREVGATATVLSPLEGEPESGDYVAAMRANLAALQTALDCS